MLTIYMDLTVILLTYDVFLSDDVACVLQKHYRNLLKCSCSHGSLAKSGRSTVNMSIELGKNSLAHPHHFKRGIIGLTIEYSMRTKSL